MTDFEAIPLSLLLKTREVYRVFDTEFQEAGWLDASVLLSSEGTLMDLYNDKTVPYEVLDKICERLKVLILY